MYREIYKLPRYNTTLFSLSGEVEFQERWDMKPGG